MARKVKAPQPPSMPVNKPAPAHPAAVKQETPGPAPQDRSNRVIETKPTITREQIALAAYFRWKRQGGDATSNWLAAEQELLKAIGTRY